MAIYLFYMVFKYLNPECLMFFQSFPTHGINYGSSWIFINKV